MNRPEYFEAIHAAARARWNQLEADKELAAPWHQLFKQVQSPDHVVSELLQNADDAGATWASAKVQDDAFLFSHNGGDFERDHFASLCRFGYSNKRTLHTIGFRGIGFKSVFSLGDRVELLTPSLSVSFERGRFTQPNWVAADPPGSNLTVVRVVLSDGRRESLERNFATWRKSPVSLLFFSSIRTLEIGEERVSWASAGPGPVNRSEIVALESDPKTRYFHFRSLPEHFPPAALTEIRQERMVGDDEETDFPPCTVEIVTHESGRLFVVLPTEVVTPLPLSANAPFIQDPARLRIKDPAASPTNRWVLGRVGDLAAVTMLDWLANTDLPVSDRAEAYRLLPKAIPQEDSLANRCASVAEQAFALGIADRPVLLSEDGRLLPANGCVPLPNDLLDVWEPGMAAELLDAAKRPALSRYVTATARQRLQERALLEKFDNEAFLSLLAKAGLPKPPTWRQLLSLWSYVARARGSAPRFGQPISQRIVPVKGRDHLVDPSEVVRVKERLDVLQESEWEFLQQHLTILDHEWIRYLGGEGDKGAATALSQANDMLESMDLARPTSLDFVLDQAARGLLKARRAVRDWVTLANIAARTNTEVGDHFRFVTRDGSLRKPDIGLFLDADGSLEELLPEDWRATRLLHEEYDSDHGSCIRDEWRAWASSDKSCLAPFVVLIPTRHDFWSQSEGEQEARRRGYEGGFEYRYRGRDLALEDWDFPGALWSYWQGVSQEDPAIWSRVIDKVFRNQARYTDDAKAAKLFGVSTHGSGHPAANEQLVSNWVMRFRELPCLPDTRGHLRKPGDLLRRTPATEPVLDVEPFVHASLDIEANRPLLDLLGVGSDASKPDGILARIRALAEADDPPVQELDKWYRRLDQLLGGCTTDDLMRVRLAFQGERLIYTEAGFWETAVTVSVGPGEGEVPDAPLVRPSVRDLTLWARLGVPDRPTVERAIDWLRSLEPGKSLPTGETKPLRALLARYPDIVAEKCGHWLDLTGAWRPLSELRFSLTMRGLTEFKHLFLEHKRATADLRMLKEDALEKPPFCRMSSLALVVEERPGKANLRDCYSRPCPWLTEAGRLLCRVTLDNEEATRRVRDAGERLDETVWWIAKDLELTPYIEGAPAGTTRRADSFWRASDLYTRDLSEARLARIVPDELGRAFDDLRVLQALGYAFERSVEQVRAFFEENFELAPTDGPTHPEDRPTQPAPAKEPDGYLGPTRDPVEEGDGDGDEFGDSGDEPAEPEDDDEEGAHRRKAKRRTPKPDTMERFAIAKGFRPQSPGRYRHPGGDLIVKGIEHAFPWQLYDAEGKLKRFYLPQNHCLEREPLALDADAWSMIQHRPELYSLVLLNAEGVPVELSGHNLRTMSEEGVLSLHPATYRLVYDRDRKRDGA